MKIFVVHKTVGGYAKEDFHESCVIGAYSNEEFASKVARVTYAKMDEIELNFTPKGIYQDMKVLGLIKDQ